MKPSFRLSANYWLFIIFVLFFLNCKHRLEFLKESELKSASEQTTSIPYDKDTYLQGVVDFIIGPHLAGRKDLYHNRKAGRGRELEKVDFVRVDHGSGIRIVVRLESGQEKSTGTRSLYIPRNSTNRGKEAEIISNFLDICKKQIGIACNLKSTLHFPIPEDLSSQSVLFTKWAFDVGASMNGFWLVDMGLGYEIIQGSALKINGFLQVKSLTSLIYNLREEQLLGYLVTEGIPLAGRVYQQLDYVQCGTDFSTGPHLIGKKDVYHNNLTGEFSPTPVEIISTSEPNQKIRIKFFDTKAEQTVSPTTLYIQRSSTTLGKEQQIISEFLKICESDTKSSCYLSTEVNTTSLPEETKITINRFKSFSLNTKSMAIGNWLVDMGLGYEILAGQASRKSLFLEITTSNSVVYNVKPKQLLGYLLSSKNTVSSPQRKRTQSSLKTTLNANRSDYLQAGQDFSKGHHLVGRENVYYNSTGHGFKPEKIDVLSHIPPSSFKIRQESGETKEVGASSLYVLRNTTSIGKESEVVSKFLKIYSDEKPSKIICHLREEIFQKNSLKPDHNLDIFTSLSVPVGTILKGAWLANIGLGYEILQGEATRQGNYLQVKTKEGTNQRIYNLMGSQLLGYWHEE